MQISIKIIQYPEGKKGFKVNEKWQSIIHHKTALNNIYKNA